MIVTPRRVTITPLKFGEDETMCVYIRDDAHPKKTWKHVFVAGIDSYDQDTSKTSKSLGAMCVMTREHTISGLPRKVPVACIRTRPPRKEMFYDLCLMLSVYFDIKNNVLIDVRCPAIIPWFKDRGGEVYLAKRPVKFEKEDTSQGHDYGVSLNIYSKALMVGIMQTHIYDYSKDTRTALRFSFLEVNSISTSPSWFSSAMRDCSDFTISSVVDTEYISPSIKKRALWETPSFPSIL